jgi:hypothetical protein
MPAMYDKMGIRFLYPENWTLDEEDAVNGCRSVSVYSPQGAFWSVALHSREIDPQDLSRSALDAMKQVYDDAEAEDVSETIAGRQLAGFDLNFDCLDLTNTALIRGFRTEAASCVIFCQAEDRDFQSVEQVFRAMTASLLSNSGSEDSGSEDNDLKNSE